MCIRQPCQKWQPVKLDDWLALLGTIMGRVKLDITNKLCYSYSFINILKIGRDSIWVVNSDFKLTPNPNCWENSYILWCIKNRLLCPYQVQKLIIYFYLFKNYVGVVEGTLFTTCISLLNTVQSKPISYCSYYNIKSRC